MIIIIAALAKNRVIGNNNDLIWHLPNDLKRFKRLTLGHPMIMGSKTFESLGGKPLPKRTNIVVTRQNDYHAPGAVICHSLQEAIELAKKESATVFIAGGGNIYRQALDLSDAMELTIINKDFAGDTTFPEWGDAWVEVAREDIDNDPDADFSYSFVRFEKK
ncbi:MAG: dihydrofolate reductase [Cryomorphaceae bacterium]|nr:dihydrofolate reductase [Cryomorphaceae bacterium]